MSLHHTPCRPVLLSHWLPTITLAFAASPAPSWIVTSVGSNKKAMKMFTKGSLASYASIIESAKASRIVVQNRWPHSLSMSAMPCTSLTLRKSLTTSCHSSKQATMQELLTCGMGSSASSSVWCVYWQEWNWLVVVPQWSLFTIWHSIFSSSTYHLQWLYIVYKGVPPTTCQSCPVVVLYILWTFIAMLSPTWPCQPNATVWYVWLGIMITLTWTRRKGQRTH